MKVLNSGFAFKIVRTSRRLSHNDFNNMTSVVEFCDWLVQSPKEVVGGRNFSVSGDNFKNSEFSSRLLADRNFFKLRRHGNKVY